MFEEIKQPPDIFADTDKAENIPPPFRPSAPPAAGPAVPPIVPVAQPLVSAIVPPATPSTRQRSNHTLVLVLGAIIVIVVGAWLSTKILGSQKSMTANLDLINQVVEEQAETSIPVYSEITREPEVVPEVITEPEIKRIDSDKDGLFDDTEKELGTDINSPDTDDDGLFDLEEAEVYKTNPLNPDTDGDGFRDGEEVKNGYNPNGSGKLFSLPGNE